MVDNSDDVAGKMKDLSAPNFGVLIAFALPGFVLLLGLSLSYQEVGDWLMKAAEANGPTIGGFLYATLASLSLGLLISALRWMFVDHFLIWVTRVKRYDLDFSKAGNAAKFAAFQGVVENHYRYYQYYSNTLIALLFSLAVYGWHRGGMPPGPITWSVWLLIFALLLASRDCLKKYYSRAHQILC